ncbi:MAG: hypothetical protein REI78_06475 [Pedobacter sp.]|nr:hypothetical protein [Pedobacter sp.]MDQ8052650.1 hypothetical protein [Pedobacter sp.]
MNKIRLFQLLIAIVIASQGIFYLLGGASAAKSMSITTFSAFRNAIDQVIASRLRILYYAALVLGLVVLFLLRKEMSGPTFILSLVALLMVMVDIVLALKISLPINKAFHSYPNGHDAATWKNLQFSWIRMIVYRGICAIIALLALLLSWKK